jgi:hypothetical protein
MRVIIAKVIHYCQGKSPLDNKIYLAILIRMARPKKDASDRKTADIRIPLTEEQKQRVVNAAESGEQDVATWLRPIVLMAADERLKTKRKK